MNVKGLKYGFRMYAKLAYMQSEEIQKITNYIFLKSNPQKADMALVFGTRYHEGLDKVYELYRDGLIKNILISGGNNRFTGENEASEMSKKLLAMGVKKEDLVLEDRATNSLENVIFSKDVIERQFGLGKVKKIIAIVKHYHSRRALMTLKRHFPAQIELIPVTYEVNGFTAGSWFDSEKGREKVFGELEKIKKYLAKGDIQKLD